MEKKIKNLCEVLNTFENNMENGAFAPKEQMLHSPLYFQIHDISKAFLWSKGLNVVYTYSYFQSIQWCNFYTVNSEIFVENLFSRSDKRYICDIKKSQ